MSVPCQQLPSAKPTQGRVSVTQNTTPADRLANGRNIVFAKNALPDRHPEPQPHQIHVRREPRVYLPRRDGAKAKARLSSLQAHECLDHYGRHACRLIDEGPSAEGH
jgi:hypothetical protein